MSGCAGRRPVSGSGKARLHELVFVQLMHEVEHGAPGARLSARLRIALERMSPTERRELVSRQREGCAPLFVAARRGNAEVVEYLVHVCGAPLEQRGAYSAGGADGGERGERGAHSVTALWAAAVGGRLAALRALADAGAALDARSDSGSTPLRSACFMTHLDAVRFLCARGADVHARNHSGGTCLINGVQSARLTRFLLSRGVNVDAQDAHGNTALHYAIQEHRADTARVLLAGGASPHVRSAAGDDALRTACVRGAAPIVRLLCEGALGRGRGRGRGQGPGRGRGGRARYSAERLADAHELLGATQLDEMDDVAAALASWRRATDIRYSGPVYVNKRGEGGAGAGGESAARALRGAREWRTHRELDALAMDEEALHTQALLVAVRLLGEHHKDTVLRLMYRGAWYCEAGRWRRCAELWTWALQIRLTRDTLLHADTCHSVCALTRLLVDEWLEARAHEEEDGEGAGRAQGGGELHEAVMRVLRLIARAIPESHRLMCVRPWCARQAEAWECALRCLAHLAAAAESGAASSDARADLVRELAGPVRARAATPAGGLSLLHLACSRLTHVRSAYGGEEAAPGALPSARAARLLLEAGADARARDRAGRTPLHLAALPYNCSAELLEVLVCGGAHACTPDARGATPLDLLPPGAGAARDVLRRRVSLACLAARALVRTPRAAPECSVPRTLRPFLALHRNHSGD